MVELLKWAEMIGPYLETVIWAVGALAALLAAALVAYVLKTGFAPLMSALRGLLLFGRWLFAYRPGTIPPEVVNGLSFGGRMVAWAALVGLAFWFLFHWLGGAS